jgi:hypothetical protein
MNRSSLAGNATASHRIRASRRRLFLWEYRAEFFYESPSDATGDGGSKVRAGRIRPIMLLDLEYTGPQEKRMMQ